MDRLKIGLVIAAGLGSTWAARVSTDALFDTASPAMLTQSEEPGAAAGTPSPPPAIPEMSREEMEAELKRARDGISGSPVQDAGLREFRPTRPLPADLAIALPSDI
jgi:hypothetical protein